MESTETTQVQEAPIHYNPNQLVTYKVINGDTVSYPTDKVVDLEWTLEKARRSEDKAKELQSTINRILDEMTEDSWYNPNTEAAEILNDLCTILQFSPVKTIEFTANISLNGSIEIPLSDYQDMDLSDYVFENLSIDSYTGTMDVNGWDIDSVDEC